MDPTSPHDQTEPDKQITTLVGEYLDRRHAGEHLTPEQFLAEHPDAPLELKTHLGGLTQIDAAWNAWTDSVVGEPGSAAPELPAIAGYELIEEIGLGHDILGNLPGVVAGIAGNESREWIAGRPWPGPTRSP